MSDYVMGRTAEEHERLRRQAEVWASATGRLIDRAGLSPGDRCLDVGCGTGAAMELMAARGGVVTGLDVDASLEPAVVGTFVRADVETDDDAVPPGGFELVYGRLILLHVADPAAVLRRMWRWVAPGGTLVVQDYDMRTVGGFPPSSLVDEWRRVFLGAYTAAGRDVGLGVRLPALFAEAGIGAPDGTDVTGRLGTMADSAAMLAATFRSIAPLAISQGLTTEAARDAWLSEIDTAARVYGDHSAMWPLLIGALKRKQAPTRSA